MIARADMPDDFTEAGREERVPALHPAWLIVAAAALTLLTASRVYLSLSIKGMSEPVLPIVAGEALRWSLWLPVVPLILALDRRAGFARRRWPTAVGVHFAAAAAVLLAHTLVMTAVGSWAGWYFTLDTPRDTLLVQIVHEGPAALLVYAAIVAAAHVRRHLREQEGQRLAQSSLEGRLARERLRNLQMQLHPHFLFNALHAVGGIIREGDRKTAVETVSDLGDLLRRSLEHGDRHLVPLDEELDFIGAYLKIQRARYGPRLRVTVAAGEDTRDALVPHLILQPLVENAIRHGTSRVESGGTISVTAAARGARLVLEVRDDGPGPIESDNAEGIGLRNTRERLKELYGRDFSMRLERQDDDGTRVALEIPFRTTEGPPV